MDTGVAITVKYWIASDQGRKFADLEGVDDFRRELAADYVSVVKGRPAGAGGFTHLYVEVISSLSLSHLVQLLLDGITFDLIKRGTESFALRPFLAAYKKLRDRNKAKRLIDIAELQIHFQDSVLLIHEVSTDTIAQNLEKILLSVAHNYEHLAISDGEIPFLIHVPVFEDLEKDRLGRFRVRGHIDETIRSDGPAEYFTFWGLEYILDTDRRVYDVTRRLLLDERFSTLEEYWAEWTRRRGRIP
jgi:hypothetical protein